MIDHVSIAVGDLAAATRFYRAVLAPLGLSLLVERDATAGFGKGYPEFWLNLRADHRPAENPGAHVCLRAADERQQVFVAVNHVQSAVRGPLGALLGHQTGRVRFRAQCNV